MSKQNKAKSKEFERLVRKNVADIQKGNLTFSELDFTNPVDVFVAKGALQVNIAFLEHLDQNDPSQLNLMLVALANNTRGILHIQNPNEKLIATYVKARLTETAKALPGATLLNSFDNKPVISLQYASHDGETISYFDEKLSLLNNLKVNAKVTFKVDDAQALASKLDVSLEYFNAQLLIDAVTPVITDTIRAELLTLAKVDGVTFFELSANYGKLAERILANANAALAAYGIVVNTFAIDNIESLDNTFDDMEKQYLTIAKEKCWKTYQNEMQAAALVNYEKKAEIHNKYPEFAATLTEEEKDLALNRYLEKNGKETKKILPLQKKLLAKRARRSDPSVVSYARTPFSFNGKYNGGFLKRFIFFLVVFVGVSIFLLMQGDAMANSQTLGFGLLAVTAVLFGTILGFKYKTIRGDKGAPQENFNAAYAKYVNELANKKAKVTLEAVTEKESENE